jgi:hypothetical protein
MISQIPESVLKPLRKEEEQASALGCVTSACLHIKLVQTTNLSEQWASEVPAPGWG